MWNPGHVSVRVRVFERVSLVRGTHFKFGSVSASQFHSFLRFMFSSISSALLCEIRRDEINFFFSPTFDRVNAITILTSAY